MSECAAFPPNVTRTDAYLVRSRYRDGYRAADTFHDVRECAEREALRACGYYADVNIVRVAPFGYATRRAEGGA